jgi:hypothetical protein
MYGGTNYWYNNIMTKKNIKIVLLLIFCLFPLCKIAAQTFKAGFIPGDIWYSKDPFMENDKIEIYSFIFNPDDRELSGAVVFFDNNVYLGKKNFILPSKTAKDVYINWTVTVGDHNIFAKIEDAKFLISEGKYEQLYLAQNETGKSSRTVAKKIVNSTITDSAKTNTLGETTITNLQKTIEEKTPDFIFKPIVSTADKLEEFRMGTAKISDDKKEEVKKQIHNLEVLNEKIDTSKTDKSNLKEATKADSSDYFLKPFEYVKLFFLSIFSFVLNSKFAFYGLIILIIFFTFYFTWKKILK